MIVEKKGTYSLCRLILFLAKACTFLYPVFMLFFIILFDVLKWYKNRPAWIWRQNVSTSTSFADVIRITTLGIHSPFSFLFLSLSLSLSFFNSSSPFHYLLLLFPLISLTQFYAGRDTRRVKQLLNDAVEYSRRNEKGRYVICILLTKRGK